MVSDKSLNRKTIFTVVLVMQLISIILGQAEMVFEELVCDLLAYT